MQFGSVKNLCVIIDLRGFREKRELITRLLLYENLSCYYQKKNCMSFILFIGADFNLSYEW
jgi:hypothetical protein